mgnify:CR=1 FL=1
MENNENKMSSTESLKIISDMINRTKMNIKESAFHLLFWGWLITIISLTEYFLTIFSVLEEPWIVWLLTIPGVFVSMIYGFVVGKKQQVYTYADRLFMWIWLSFLVSTTILVVYIGSVNLMHLVGPFILLMAAFAVFISGIVIKFKPLIAGGISIWIFSLIGFFTGPAISPLAIPAAVITGYLVPGYMLKKTGTENG